jgi:uncharacterized protein DUF6602
MSAVTRQQIFAQAAKKLRHDFGELSTIPHNALKGHEAEKIVRTFLSGHLPKRFGVGAGFIIDPNNALSKQTDVIIYDAINCPVYRASEDAGIFPSDNVAAVVEVKANLDKDRLIEAYDNITAAKSLAKTKSPDLPILQTSQTFGCVFAFESSITLNTAAQHYAALIRERGLGRHIDEILILDRGLISLAGKPQGLPWSVMFMEGFGGDAGEGAHIGVSAHDLGDNSLDAFFRVLLAQLIHFRAIASHPGFNWAHMLPSGQMTVEYVGSITHEKDPKMREQNLRKYTEEVVRDFQSERRVG